MEGENYEILVVDDGSTDNTSEVVKPYLNERTAYYPKQNAERAAARNYGAERAKGNYVNFFDSDDIALPNHAAEATKLIAKYNNPEWFHLCFSWANAEGKVFKDNSGYSGETLNHLMHQGNILGCDGVFVRKDIALEYRFNEDRAMSASEDYEFWLRLTARYPLYYTNTITSILIDHDMRSVRTINGDALVRRLELMIHYLSLDNTVVSYFGSKFNQIKMDANSYIALHLSEVPKYKLRSIQYLLKAIGNSPVLLTKRRFLAIIKHLILTW
jgi:glycosyltransferase involved in cell wall biosynthesis